MKNKKIASKIMIGICYCCLVFFILFMSMFMMMGASEEENGDNLNKTVDGTDSMENFINIALNECKNVAGKTGGEKYRQW